MAESVKVSYLEPESDFDSLARSLLGRVSSMGRGDVRPRRADAGVASEPQLTPPATAEAAMQRETVEGEEASEQRSRELVEKGQSAPMQPEWRRQGAEKEDR